MEGLEQAARSPEFVVCLKSPVRECAERDTPGLAHRDVGSRRQQGRNKPNKGRGHHRNKFWFEGASKLCLDAF